MTVTARSQAMVEGRMERVYVCVFERDTKHTCLCLRCVFVCVECLVDAAGLDVLLMCC